MFLIYAGRNAAMKVINRRYKENRTGRYVKTCSQGDLRKQICSAWFVNRVIPPARVEAMPEIPSNGQDNLTENMAAEKQGSIAERAKTADWAIVNSLVAIIMLY
jgi:hypothetical protein